MAIAISALNIHWQCKHTWRRASYNTSWCLLRFSIGDMGTILSFHVNGIEWPVLWIMSLAIFNCLLAWHLQTGLNNVSSFQIEFG